MVAETAIFAAVGAAFALAIRKILRNRRKGRCCGGCGGCSGCTARGAAGKKKS